MCRLRKICLLHYVTDFIFLCDWSGTQSTVTAATYWPIVPALDERWWWLWSNSWNEWVAEEIEVVRENLFQWHCVDHRSTWLDPGSNPRYRGRKPSTNGLSYGVVMWKVTNTCKIWGVHGGHYEECRLLGYKNPVRTLHETRTVSATQPSLLMLCKIWGFHGGDYEEWRVLGYKTPVRTSQETHYISTTASSQLMLCKIWGFHGGDCEECRLLGYKTQFLLHRGHITSPLQSPDG
jgi:hypothetical protein